MSGRKRAPLRVTVDEISVNAENVELASLVTDDGQELVVPLASLPPGTQHDDVLLVRFQQDRRTRAARGRRVAELQERLFGGESGPHPPAPSPKGRGGDER